jgi:hypothetical protein
MVVKAYEEQIVVFRSSVDIVIDQIILRPCKTVTMQIAFGGIAGIRKDFAFRSLFHPTQIGVVAWVLPTTVCRVAISVVVEILTITMPAAR